MILDSIKNLAEKLNKSENPKKLKDWIRIGNLINLYYGERITFINPEYLSIECGLDGKLGITIVNDILGYKKW